MQRTQVWCLIQDDSTCHRATKPMCHNYWACALGPSSHNYWSPGAYHLHTAITEPLCCNYWSPYAWSLCSATREATAVRSPGIAMKSNPCSSESPHMVTKTQHSQKLNKQINKKTPDNQSNLEKEEWSWSNQLLESWSLRKGCLFIWFIASFAVVHIYNEILLGHKKEWI